MKSVRRPLFMAALLFELSLSSAYAQTIAGTVRDATGSVLPGVTVEASSPAPRHQHLQRTFLSLRRGFHALNGSFLDDVEVFGGIAFAEDVVVFAVTGFGQFLEHALAVRYGEDVQKGNAVQPLRKDWTRRLTW